MEAEPCFKDVWMDLLTSIANGQPTKLGLVICVVSSGLGNDNLYRLTAAEEVELRVELEDFEGNITYAEYTTFKVADEEDKYRLLIGGYNDTARDSMKINHDAK